MSRESKKARRERKQSQGVTTRSGLISINEIDAAKLVSRGATRQGISLVFNGQHYVITNSKKG